MTIDKPPARPPVNTETLALFEDNVDIFADIQLDPLPGLRSSEEILSLDSCIVDISTTDVFDRLFETCIDRMAGYVSPQPVSSATLLNQVSSPPEVVNIGTFLAPKQTAQNQEEESFWKKPERIQCSYCSKLLSKAAWHHHQVCHIKARMKCRMCNYTARTWSALRRHNEYYHGAQRKRHVFFDSC